MRLQFLAVNPETGVVPEEYTDKTTGKLVLEFSIVISLEVPPSMFEPSKVIKLLLIINTSLMTGELAGFPLINAVTPVFGLIVTVLTEVGKLEAMFIVTGKVSPVV
jgi:hypothetical protein